MALDIPAPASPDDEMIFLRVRSQRSAEALKAVFNVLAHPRRTDLDYAWTVARWRWLAGRCVNSRPGRPAQPSVKCQAAGPTSWRGGGRCAS
jgi:hypothetical protein